MVIRDLHIVSVVVFPGKTDPPLIVDPDAVPAFPFSFQGFLSVAGGNKEVGHDCGSVQHPQFPEHHSLQILREFSGILPLEDFCVSLHLNERITLYKI
jgi:hypothetical protein